MIQQRLLILFLLSCVALGACSGKAAVKPPEKFDPEKAFTSANELFDQKDYENARASFLEVKNRDFSKKFAPLAQLKIADSYVKEEEFELAVSEYRKFLEAYPDHQYASYAQYQIAMVYFDQIESPERGYGGAAKALQEFEKLKKMFPRNPYKDVIEFKIEKCKDTIAEYEHLVGKFYFKKDAFRAAIGRFEELMQRFPMYKGEADVLYLTGISYKKLGEKAMASEYFTRLIEKYPNNTLVKDAQKALVSLKP